MITMMMPRSISTAAILVRASVVYGATVFLCRIRLPATSTLFPYTTLFRSVSTDSPDKTGVDRVLNVAAAFEQMGKGCVDRKSTRLNSSHVETSYAVFCLKKTMLPENAESRGCDRAS